MEVIVPRCAIHGIFLLLLIFLLALQLDLGADKS